MTGAEQQVQLIVSDEQVTGHQGVTPSIEISLQPMRTGCHPCNNGTGGESCVFCVSELRWDTRAFAAHTQQLFSALSGLDGPRCPEPRNKDAVKAVMRSFNPSGPTAEQPGTGEGVKGRTGGAECSKTAT